MSQRGPGNLPGHTSLKQLIKTETLVGDPQITGSVLSDRSYRPAGNAFYRDISVILQIAESAKRRNPDSPAIILKKRIRVRPFKPAVAVVAAGVSPRVIFGLRAVLTVNRDLTVNPSVQALVCGQPNTSISVGQNGNDSGMQQPLVHRKSRDGKVAKAVKAIFGADPNIAFTVLKESVNQFARKTVGRRKHVRPPLMHMHKPLTISSDPQTAITITE